MISIIGSGRVGTALAFLLTSHGTDDVLLVNRTLNDVKGKALDLTNTIPADSDIAVTGTNDFSLIKKSHMIVISASMSQPLSSRLDSLQIHLRMIKDIARKIQRYAPEARVLIISNPVDIMTYVFQRYSGIKRQRIIGIAGNLDSTRFRYLLSEEMSVRPSAISDVCVIGEHGDSMVPVFSMAKSYERSVSNMLDKQSKLEITKKLRDYWKMLRDGGWISTYGIAQNSFEIIDSLTAKKKMTTTASINLRGEYGLSDLAIGVPIKIMADGSVKVSQINLDSSEKRLFLRSADTIKNQFKI